MAASCHALTFITTVLEELADETLNRIGRTLESGGVIMTRPPARYCYVVARFVLLEDIRRDRKHVHFDESRTADLPHVNGFGAAELDAGAAEREVQLECLDRCLQELRPDQRELIIEYYREGGRQKIERRRELAVRLGITTNALSIRAYRIRDTLMGCVQGCCGGTDRCEVPPSYANGARHRGTSAR